MAHVGSKGYYVKKLREIGINKIGGRYTETFKTTVLLNHYHAELEKRNK